MSGYVDEEVLAVLDALMAAHWTAATSTGRRVNSQSASGEINTFYDVTSAALSAGLLMALGSTARVARLRDLLGDWGGEGMAWWLRALEKDEADLAARELDEFGDDMLVCTCAATELNSWHTTGCPKAAE